MIANEEQDGKKLQKFRVASDFISRLIAPSTLNLMTEANDGKKHMHHGQQYISFVDSRQTAAQGTIKQNVEEERLWVYSKIFHELNRRSLHGLTKEDAMAKVMEQNKNAATPDEMMKNMQIMQNLMCAG